MTEEPRQYCAEMALAAGEPLLGTAPQVDAWLLVEYQPIWDKKALENNDLPDTVNAWIQDYQAQLSAAGYKPRVQFIRRRRDRNHQLNVFTALGKAINIVETMNVMPSIAFMPDMNIWCPHTMKPRPAIPATE